MIWFPKTLGTYVVYALSLPERTLHAEASAGASAYERKESMHTDLVPTLSALLSGDHD